MKQKMYKVTFYVIPFYVDYDEEDMKVELDNKFDGIVELGKFEETDILSWTENHELNMSCAKPEDFEKYFKKDEIDGETF